MQRQIIRDSLVLLKLICMYCDDKGNGFLLCTLFEKHSVCALLYHGEYSFKTPHVSTSNRKIIFGFVIVHSVVLKVLFIAASFYLGSDL